MTIGNFGWQDSPSVATPLTAENMESFGHFVGAYTDTRVLKETAPNVMRTEFAGGAKGDGSTDDTAAFQAFLAAGYTYGEVPQPPGGSYHVSSALVLPQAMSLRLAPTAVIRATASMGYLLSTPTNAAIQGQRIQGGILDCNELANTALKISWPQHKVDVLDIQAWNALQHGVVIGDSGVGPNDGAQIRNLLVWRQNFSPSVPGFYGLWMNTTQDSEISQCMVVGYDTGIRNDTADNTFSHCHVWGYGNLASPMSRPSIGYYDAGGGQWYGCKVDDPITNGWVLAGSNSHLFGPRIFLADGISADNAITAISVSTLGTFGQIFAPIFRGGASSRIATAIGPSANIANIMLLGATFSNVVTTALDQLYPINGISVSSAAGGKFTVDGSFSGAVSISRGSSPTPFKIYSDAFSTLVYEVDAATGHIISGGVGAPSIGAGAGAGGSPTVAITGNDTAGTITITPGTSPGAGLLATITFHTTFGSTPLSVRLQPENAAAAGIGAYTGRSATTFTVSCTGTPTNGAPLQFTFQVIA